MRWTDGSEDETLTDKDWIGGSRTRHLGEMDIFYSAYIKILAREEGVRVRKKGALQEAWKSAEQQTRSRNQGWLVSIGKIMKKNYDGRKKESA